MKTAQNDHLIQNVAARFLMEARSHLVVPSALAAASFLSRTQTSGYYPQKPT